MACTGIGHKPAENEFCGDRNTHELARHLSPILAPAFLDSVLIFNSYTLIIESCIETRGNFLNFFNFKQPSMSRTNLHYLQGNHDLPSIELHTDSCTKNLLWHHRWTFNSPAYEEMTNEGLEMYTQMHTSYLIAHNRLCLLTDLIATKRHLVLNNMYTFMYIIIYHYVNTTTRNLNKQILCG